MSPMTRTRQRIGPNGARQRARTFFFLAILGVMLVAAFVVERQRTAGAGDIGDSPLTKASAPVVTTAGETSTTTGPKAPLLVAAGGDVIGDRQVGRFIDANGGKAVLTGVGPLLRDADLAFVNLESTASDQGQRKADKDVTFQGRPALLEGLVAAGIDVVSLANNHALDFGPAALADTRKRLEVAGIAHAGAGPDLQASRTPARLETTGGSVELLAYTSIVPEGFFPGQSSAGVNPLREPEVLLAEIRAAAKRSDWVIVSLHWGVEYEEAPLQEQVVLAHQAVDAGADLILGHHPHVLQGVELYKGRLIVYSLGDFVFDHRSRATGEAFVLRARLQPGGGGTFSMVPVYLDDTYGIPAQVTGAEADAILDRLAQASAALGTKLQREGDRLALR